MLGARRVKEGGGFFFDDLAGGEVNALGLLEDDFLSEKQGGAGIDATGPTVRGSLTGRREWPGKATESHLNRTSKPPQGLLIARG